MANCSPTTLVFPYTVAGFRGVTWGAISGQSEPKTAIDEGANKRQSYFLATAMTFSKPSTLIFQHNSGFFSPVADNNAARWKISVIASDSTRISIASESITSRNRQFEDSRTSVAIIFPSPNLVQSISTNSVPICPSAPVTRIRGPMNDLNCGRYLNMK